MTETCISSNEFVPNRVSAPAFDSYFICNSTQSSTTFTTELTETLTSIVDAWEQNNLPGASGSPSQLSLLAQQLCKFDICSQKHSTLLEMHVRTLVQHSVLPNHKHSAAHLHCPVMTSSIAAELILSLLNQSMDSWDQAPLASQIELEFVSWFARKIGFDPCRADGVFTSGGTQSNLSALMLARDSALNKEQRDVKEQGLGHDGARLRVYCSTEAHFSIARSCALLGLGHKAVTAIACDERGRLRPDLLHTQLEVDVSNGLIPMAIVATAGTTDLGAIDPIDTIATIAKTHKTWLHIDAAYGGALLLTEHKDKLKGISNADSVCIDYHKGFFQAISCAALFVKDKQLFKGLHFNADYLNREDDCETNLVEKSLSTTRRFDALKIWLSLQRVGLSQFSAMIDRVLQLTQHCAEIINIEDELELFKSPELSTVLFRFKNKTDDFHQELRRSLLYSGKAVIAETKKNQRVYLKLTLLNPCLSFKDLNALFNTILNQAKKSNKTLL